MFVPKKRAEEGGKGKKRKEREERQREGGKERERERERTISVCDHSLLFLAHSLSPPPSPLSPSLPLPE